MQGPAVLNVEDSDSASVSKLLHDERIKAILNHGRGMKSSAYY